MPHRGYRSVAQVKEKQSCPVGGKTICGLLRNQYPIFANFITHASTNETHHHHADPAILVFDATL